MDEIAVRDEVSALERSAMSINIETHEDGVDAMEMAKQIADVKRQVHEYWDDAVTAAYQAHKQLVAKRKEMLDACDKAEGIVKDKVIAWRKNARETQEAMLREGYNEQREMLLDQAEAFEKSGDATMAAIKFEMAQSMDVARPEANMYGYKIEGIKFRMSEKVVVEDEKAVPDYIGGVCVRPVDTKQIKKLRKQYPSAQIPGIKFEKTESMIVG